MIVGFVGFIGSGKGAAGDILQNEYGFIKESFAGSVKDIVSVMFDWPRNLMEGDTQYSREWREKTDQYWTNKLGYNFSPRKAMQIIGTEVGRNTFHKNFWLHRLETKIDKTKNYVITDARFPNEIDWILEMGGIVIRIKRGPEPDWYQSAIDYNQGEKHIGWALGRHKIEQNGIHSSEYSWVGYPLITETINNDGTLEDLKNNLLESLTSWYGSDKMCELLNYGEIKK